MAFYGFRFHKAEQYVEFLAAQRRFPLSCFLFFIRGEEIKYFINCSSLFRFDRRTGSRSAESFSAVCLYTVSVLCTFFDRLIGK